VIGRWLGTAAAIGQTAKLAAGVFVALAAVGGLVKAVGGATWLAIVFAAVGVVGALVALALGIVQVRAERREEWDALWRGRPGRVKEVLAGEGIYCAGVETEAREALEAAGLGDARHAPYVERAVDKPLRDRLSAAAVQQKATLIVLSGPSKAGKSRTVLEALRVVADAPGGALAQAVLFQPEQHAAAFATLAAGLPPPELKRDGPCVVWLDDMELFVKAGDGLNARTLPVAFERWKRSVLIVATEGGKGRRAAPSGEYADPLADLLRAYPPLELQAWLSEAEKQDLEASAAYSPDAAERIAGEGVGEFMIVASAIRERLRDEIDCPDGLAVARAAIDWRRLGLLRPIPDAVLRELYRPYLHGPDLPGRFEEGIKWATTPLYSQVALLLGGDPYEPYDYAVRYERERGRTVPSATWGQLIERHATDVELSSLGIAAVNAGQPEHAEAAFRRADERGDPGGAYNLGLLLAGRGDPEGAEAAYGRAATAKYSEVAQRASAALESLRRNSDP
jgi:tetratricopeptide (TPR) repeat protein